MSAVVAVDAAAAADYYYYYYSLIVVSFFSYSLRIHPSLHSPHSLAVPVAAIAHSHFHSQYLAELDFEKAAVAQSEHAEDASAAAAAAVADEHTD